MGAEGYKVVFNLLYLTVLFVPAALLLMRRFRLIPIQSGAVLFALSCAIVYVLYVGANGALRYSHTIEKESYDVNRDGHLVSSEMAPEQWERVEQMNQDTGIQMAPIFGVFVAIFITAVWFIIAEILRILMSVISRMSKYRRGDG